MAVDLAGMFRPSNQMGRTLYLSRRRSRRWSRKAFKLAQTEGDRVQSIWPCPETSEQLSVPAGSSRSPSTSFTI